MYSGLSFVIVFWWGVSGAAVATGISQVFVIVLYLWHFLGPKATLRFTKFRLDLKLIGREFRNGLSSGVTEMSAGIIVFFFNLAITRYIGEDALVSYTIVSYINSIVVMSMTGIAQGSQPLISYYHGKKETATCRKLLRYGLISAAVFRWHQSLSVYLERKELFHFLYRQNCLSFEATRQMFCRYLVYLF